MSDTLVLPRDDRAELSAHGVSVGEAFRVWLRVVALSFGGPAAQSGGMHRILVEEKKWVSESRFMHALNYCMLLPDPRGATARRLYRLAEASHARRHHGWRPVRAARNDRAYGAQHHLCGMGRSRICRCRVLRPQGGGARGCCRGRDPHRQAFPENRPMQALAAAAFVAIFFFAAPFPVIIVAAGLIGFFAASAGVPALRKMIALCRSKIAVAKIDGVAILRDK
jgi:chromate transporter